MILFDFDASIARQQRLLASLGERLARRDLSRYRYSARLWTAPRLFDAIGRRYFQAAEAGLAFLGSGDYHHFSLLRLAAQRGPLSLVLFDNHPDWMRPPHRCHCGTWVYSAARLPQVERIVIIGLESDDLSGHRFQHGDEESFESGKVVLLPARDIQAVGRRGPFVLPAGLADGETAAIARILAAIPGRQVYLSLDKDCLRRAEAATNWEQGSLSLEFVLRVIMAIAQEHHLVGVDTVGDASPPLFRSPVKWLASFIDRPADALRLAVNETQVERNEAVNLALVHCLDRFA